ncbi:MAG: hypothetical protein JNK15_11550 [Planctomycetes bacterium]|nr:hypothetical protein [Planctomycetota bacterium]
MRPSLLIAFACLAAAATAQTVVLPGSATATAGTGSNAFPWGSNASAFPGLRIQCLYDDTHFTGAPVPVTGPILITNVKWRANDVTTSWTGGTYATATLALGTAAVDHTAATTDMVANIGPDYTVVHSGAVTVLPGTGNGTGVPGPIVVDIAVNPPFLYDPTLGDLVVDTDFLNGAYAGGTLVPMDTTATTPLARRVYCSTFHPLANGVDTAAPVIEIDYVPAPAGTLATNALAGAGCIAVADASFYESFATSAAFDLSNSAITLLRSADGVVAVPGGVAFVPPSGTAQTLALTDNSNAVVTLSQPMPVGRSATTTTLGVNSNGFVTAGAGTTTTGTPSASTLLNNLRAFWAVCWHDMNPAIAGSGQVLFEEIGGIAYVTWNGVWDNAGTTAANANTMQAQFELATGNVHFVYQSMSTLGNSRMVGFSDAAGSPNAGSVDISALLPATFAAASFRLDPLTLGPTSRPVIGTNWNLSVTDIPAPGLIGVAIYGLADPALPDLSFLGMPGCGLRASLDFLDPFISAGSAHAYSLGLPNNPALLNLHIYTNAAVLLPGVNAFGALTSNGVDGKFGDV